MHRGPNHNSPQYCSLLVLKVFMFNRNKETDFMQEVRGDVKNHGFVVDWVLFVPSHRCFFLLDLPARVNEAYFDKGI